MWRPRTLLPASSRPPRHGAGIDRVFQFLLCIVFIGAIYRYCWIDASDPYKCGSLLHKGAWSDLDPNQKPPSSFQDWQPPGCMIYEYQEADISHCLDGRRLLFVGDSTVRQVFWAVAEKMGQERPDVEPPDAFEGGEDIEVESAGVSAKFIWDPWLNSTGLEQELEKFRAQPPTDGSDDSAALILTSAPGLWFARYGDVNYFQGFRNSIDRIIPYMDHAPTGSNAARAKLHQPFDKSPNLLLLSPVQSPMYRALSPATKDTITFPKMHMMNEYLEQASAYSSADVIWSYSLMTETGDGEYAADGVHVIASVDERRADILLNLRCNGDAAAKGYPYNRTCCSNYTRPNIIQRAVLISGLFILPVLHLLRRKHIKIGFYIPPAEVSSPLTFLAFILCFCFFADRTQLFEKVHVQFNGWAFGGAWATVIVAGLLSIKQSKRPATAHNGQESISDDCISQDQIDEWKGLTVAFLLIYHYTGASEITWAYKLSRILIAFYLFNTTYEYVLSSLISLDYSTQFGAAVLVRFNLMSSILPFMMRTNNTLYYIPLLCSFWFIVGHLMLRIGSRYNSSLSFLFAKIILFAMFTTALIKIPEPLELVSVVLQHTCRMTWDASSWRETISLDMYIPYVGMISAILCHRLSLNSTAPFSNHPIDGLFRFTRIRRAILQNLAILTSAISMSIFWGFFRHMSGRDTYNQWHPYVSWIPILSGLMLRISHPYLRRVHLRIFAWLGRCSLELYILQYHIWLAGDSSGLLRIGLWSRWVESALLTSIFLWASCRAAQASQGLTAWIMGSWVRMRGEDEGSEGEDDSALEMSLGADNEGISTKSLPGEDREGSLAGGWNWTLTAILGLLWIGNWIYR